MRQDLGNLSYRGLEAEGESNMRFAICNMQISRYYVEGFNASLSQMRENTAQLSDA